jgi:hypothetical protein
MTMNCARVIFLILAAWAGAGAQCPPGSLAAIVNKTNPTDSLSVSQLRRLLIGDARVWLDHKAVSVVERDASSKVFRCSLSNIVRLSDSEYRRYLIGAAFRGEETMLMQASDSDAGSARIVADTPGAIAIVDMKSIAAFSSLVKVIRVNGKNPGQAGYPL